MFLSKKTLLIVLELVILSCSSENDFRPTREWQKIEPGQKVPAGLHYRINLQTGYKEAKILDEESENEPSNFTPSSDNSQLSILPESPDQINQQQENEHITNSQRRLEEALKNIPSDKFEYTEEELKNLKNKFKTYAEIKSDMNEINLDIKTDSEIIDKLVNTYLANTTLPAQEKLNILEDLEYLVHQVDNALTFLETTALDKIILANLVNQTESKLRVKSLLLLGGLVQNNPKAQILVFENNFADHLTKVLSNVKLSTEELSATVYAYGSLLRKFPFAQKATLPKTGMPLLLDLLSTTTDIKLRIKIIVLISDFVRESIDIADDFKANPGNTDLETKMLQYKSINLDEILTDSRYCEYMDVTVTKYKNMIIDEYDFIEKIISSCLVTSEICFHDWSESPLFRHFLLILKHRYDNIKESNDEEMIVLYDNIMENINALFDALSFKEMAPMHDEF